METGQAKVIEMKRYPRGSEDFERQTAVAYALPHAIHPQHDNWRTKADALIEQLRREGWEIRR